MSMKVKWVDNRHLKLLFREIQFIASDELLLALAEAIDGEGHYLCNILSDSQIRELEKIKKNYIILSLS